MTLYAHNFVILSRQYLNIYIYTQADSLYFLNVPRLIAADFNNALGITIINTNILFIGRIAE